MKNFILFLSFIMLLNAENLDGMCQSEGDIRANLTSCYKAAVKIYNSSSDDKDFKKLQKIFLLACKNDMKEGCYSAALIYINGYNDVGSELNQTIILNRDFLTTRFWVAAKKRIKRLPKATFKDHAS